MYSCLLSGQLRGFDTWWSHSFATSSVQETCEVGDQRFDADMQESRWTVATLDVVPVETALPEGAKYLDNYSADWQVNLHLPALEDLLALDLELMLQSYYLSFHGACHTAV